MLKLDEGPGLYLLIVAIPICVAGNIASVVMLYQRRLADLLNVAVADAREQGLAGASSAHVLSAMLSEAGSPLTSLLESHRITLERLRAYHQSSVILGD